ncbi:uncharacterized protein PV09_02465 [Verruconis gallopava]|uniref:Transcription factor domain-containing protein n=1 Tax=Verruconis gallopava TaxID=253628 RepID=A0A0D1XVD8_9PEZI|nr:uncharacterized protein PV09_02465 [Verruconis gallopava]KIW06781.1 hypothetical protein PV09_02465 [Verruconis gallopava]
MPRKKAPPLSTGALAFIVSTNMEKPDMQMRKFIRSHVMVGKNVGRTLPDRRKKKALPENAPKFSHNSSGSFMNTPDEAEECLSSASLRFGNCLSTLGPADPSTDYHELNPVLRFSAIAKNLLFVLEPCIFFERRAEEWISPLTTDPVYMHCLIFTSQYYFDALSIGRFGNNVPVNRQTVPHFFKALSLLQNRLSDKSNQMIVANSTAAAIMGLSAYALIIDDVNFARKHVEALCRIVRMRGGTASFKGSEKLLLEILRNDLGLALAKGTSPMFLKIMSPEEALLQFPDLKSFLEPRNLPVAATNFVYLKDVEHKLIQAWTVLANFCTLINFAADTEQKISTHTFLHVMTSVMYQLLAMQSCFGAHNELVRLGLIVFSSSIFLQWKTIGLRYEQLTKTFLKHMKLVSNIEMSPRLILWMVMIGAISLLDQGHDHWVRPLFLMNMRLCGVQTWQDVRSVMTEFLWISFVHDQPAKSVYERIAGQVCRREQNLYN